MPGDQFFKLRVSSEWIGELRELVDYMNSRPPAGPVIDGDVSLSDVVFLSVEAFTGIAPPAPAWGLSTRDKFRYSQGEADQAAAGIARRIALTRRTLGRERIRRALLKSTFKVVEGDATPREEAS